VRAGALGDVLLLRRTIAALHGGGYEVTLLAPAASGGVLLGPGASEVRHLLDWERGDVAALASGGDVPESLRRDLAGHDLAAAFTRGDALVSGLRALALRVLARDPTPPPGLTAPRWLAAVLAGVGLDPDADPPPCVPTDAESAAARPWLERLPPRFLAVHPGSGSPRKNWPVERFLELARRLRPDEPWLVPIGPADEAAARPTRAHPRCVVAEGLGPRVLGAVLAGAGLFVGNDSGVSHLAAAWGAPTVALFGPTDGRVWAPDGPRVVCVQSRTGETAGITVEEAAEAALRSAGPGPPSC
jgi:ADP-heptose:LPS heptosyltransferase